jgi:hypothetical protein
MANIHQIQVFNQKESGGVLGRDGCGLNTFKNVILSLLLAQGSITKKQFTRLVNNKDLVYDIYDSVREIIAKRDSNGMIIAEGSEIAEIDVSMPKLFEIFDRAKAGKINLSKYGISKNMLSNLALARDGKQAICITNMGEYFDCGLSCLEEDLFVASMLAKLARTKGEFYHVFAIGYDNGMYGHWMTVVLYQDKYGEKQWQFMDSYNNQTLYKNILIDKLNGVLRKSSLELEQYLVEAYDNSSDLIDRRFADYFDVETNRPIQGKKIDLTGNGEVIKDNQEFYITDQKNRNEYINYISNRFIFMENAGWLCKHIGGEELKRVQRLHAITQFMLDNGADAHPAIKDKLNPIGLRLAAVIASNKLTEQTQPLQKLMEEESQYQLAEVNNQSLMAMAAVENARPKQTSSLFKRLVCRISFDKNTPKEYNDVLDGKTIKPSIRVK